jgi:hypothetical protein
MDEGDTELLPGEEFERNFTARMETDSGYLEDPVYGCLAFDHGASILQISLRTSSFYRYFRRMAERHSAGAAASFISPVFRV